MNIYLISNMYPSLENPGYGIFVKNVVEGLRHEGIETKYASVIEGKGRDIFDKIIKYCRFYLSIFCNYFRHYECLYVHFPTYSAPILWLLMHVSRKKLVINFHGEDLLYHDESVLQQKLGKISDKLTKRYGDLIIVPSAYFKKIVLDRGLADEKNIYVSPSGGIDETIFYNQGKKEKKDYIHLGFVGRLEELKGVVEFIEACIELNKIFPLRATIIGYGPLNDLVKYKISEYNIFNLVYGVPQMELPHYYHSFDLFCFPSKRKCESLGLVGIESMACGTPVIGSNIGGIVSYLEDNLNGYVIRTDCLKQDMVAKVKYYMNISIEEKIRLSENGIKTSKLYYRSIVCKDLARNLYSFLR